MRRSRKREGSVIGRSMKQRAMRAKLTARGRTLRCEALEDRRMLSGGNTLETNGVVQIGDGPVAAGMAGQTLRVRVVDQTGRAIDNWHYNGNTIIPWADWSPEIYQRLPGEHFEYTPSIYEGRTFPAELNNYTEVIPGIRVSLFKDGEYAQSGVFEGGTDIVFDIDEPGLYTAVASTTFQADLGYKSERLPFGSTLVDPSEPPIGRDCLGEYEVYKTDWIPTNYEYRHYKRYTYDVVASTVTFVTPGEDDFALIPILNDIDLLGEISCLADPGYEDTIDLGTIPDDLTNAGATTLLKQPIAMVAKEVFRDLLPVASNQVANAIVSSGTSNVIFAALTPEAESQQEVLADIGFGVASSLVVGSLGLSTGGVFVVQVAGAYAWSQAKDAYYVSALKNDLELAAVDDLALQLVPNGSDATLYVLNRGAPLRNVSVVEFEEFGITPGMGAAGEHGMIEMLDTGEYEALEGIPGSWLEQTGPGVGAILVWDSDLVYRANSAKNLLTELADIGQENIVTAPVVRSLAVSAPPLTTISLSTSDNNGDRNGTGDFTRIFDKATGVTLTAPQTNGDGDSFSHWVWTGGSYTSRSLSIVMDADQSVAAIYEPIESLLRVAGSTSPNPISLTREPGGAFRTYLIPVENAGRGDVTVGVTKEGGAASWTTINETSFQLAPGEVHQHEIRIGVPEDAAAGKTSVTVYYNGVGLKFDLEVVDLGAARSEALTPSNGLVDGTSVVKVLSADYSNWDLFRVQKNHIGGFSSYFDATELQANAATKVSLNVWVKKVNASASGDSLLVFLNGTYAGTIEPSDVSSEGLMSLGNIDIRSLIAGQNTLVFKPQTTNPSDTTVLWEIYDGYNGINPSARVEYGEAAWRATAELPPEYWKAIEDGFLDYAHLTAYVQEVGTPGKVYLYNYESKKTSVDSESIGSEDLGKRVSWTLSSSEITENSDLVLKGDSSSQTRVRLSDIRLEVKLLNNDPSITLTKNVSKQQFTVGEEIVVTVQIENTREGSTTGYETDLFDAALPTGLRLVSGKMYVNDIDNIKYGEIETNRYTIVADEPGNYVLGSASIRYENLDGDRQIDESVPVALFITAGPLDLEDDISLPSLATDNRTLFSVAISHEGSAIEDAVSHGVIERLDGANWVPVGEYSLGWSPTMSRYIGESEPLLDTGRYRAFVTAEKDLYDVTATTPLEFNVTSARLVVASTTLEVDEGGSETLLMKLSDDPLEAVEVTIARDYGDSDIALTPSTFVLDSSNWYSGVNISVTASADDDYIDGVAGFVAFSDSFGTVPVTVFENDLRGADFNADFNADFRVNIADYTLWRNQLGANVAPGDPGDANFDGHVDQTDYQIWKSQFGTVLQPLFGIYVEKEFATVYEADWFGPQDGYFAVSLFGAPPAEQVTVSIERVGGDPNISTSEHSLTFNSSNWGEEQNVHLATVRDASFESSNATFRLSAPGTIDTYVTVHAYDEARRFDFGTPDSPVAAGYVQVTPETRYDSILGYGWKSGVVTSVARSTGTDLTSDLNRTDTSSGSAVFAVDLPYKYWDISVTLGDPESTSDMVRYDLYVGDWLIPPEYFYIDTGPNFTTLRLMDFDLGGQLRVEIEDLGGVDPYASIVGIDIQLSPSSVLFGAASSLMAGDNTDTAAATPELGRLASDLTATDSDTDLSPSLTPALVDAAVAAGAHSFPKRLFRMKSELNAEMQEATRLDDQHDSTQLLAFRYYDHVRPDAAGVVEFRTGLVRHHYHDDDAFQEELLAELFADETMEAFFLHGI